MKYFIDGEDCQEMKFYTELQFALVAEYADNLVPLGKIFETLDNGETVKVDGKAFFLSEDEYSIQELTKLSGKTRSAIYKIKDDLGLDRLPTLDEVMSRRSGRPKKY